MSDDVDDFQFQPPEHTDTNMGGGWYPPFAEYAWILELIKLKLDNTSLPDEIKNDLVADMVPYINNASMTKISTGQVREFIGGFNEIMHRFRIYKVKKKYVPEYNYVWAYLRELLIMNLNKSREGWQGDHVFERKTTYDVKQTRKDLTEQVKNALGRKKRKEVTTVEEQ